MSGNGTHKYEQQLSFMSFANEQIAQSQQNETHNAKIQSK